MRVLFLTETFWPDIGGVEVLSAQLLPALRDRGHEIAVAGCHGPRGSSDDSLFEGMWVHRFAFREALQRRDLRAVKMVAERLGAVKRQFAPDLIHLNASEPGLFFHYLTRDVCPSATLVTVHLLLDEVRSPDSLFARAFERAGWVTAVSSAMLGKAIYLAPAIARRSSVVYNALRQPAEAPAPLPFDGPCLLCIGRVSREKGFDLALEAFATVVARFPAARLVIAGDGPERAGLERRAGEMALQRPVEFTGWVAPHSVPALMNGATVVLVPSRWEEPFGLVALQAAQMGRPVVAARAGGLPELVLDGETGLLFAKDDIAGLADGIVRLLSDPAFAERLGAAARVRCDREFDFDRMVDAYDALYRRLVRS